MSPLLGVAFGLDAVFGFNVFDRIESWRTRQKDLATSRLVYHYIDSGYDFRTAWGKALADMRFEECDEPVALEKKEKSDG